MKIWWCQEHESAAYEGGATCHASNWNTDIPCRMVPMRLIPDNGETVDRIVSALRGELITDDYQEVAIEVLAALDGEMP